MISFERTRVHLEELSVFRFQLATILFTQVVVHRLPFGKSILFS
jgi:hypothetical protein